jgi:hypothetical protein
VTNRTRPRRSVRRPRAGKRRFRLGDFRIDYPHVWSIGGACNDVIGSKRRRFAQRSADGQGLSGRHAEEHLERRELSAECRSSGSRIRFGASDRRAGEIHVELRDIARMESSFRDLQRVFR